MGVGAERHHDAGDHDEPGGHGTDGGRGVIKKREHGRDRDHEHAEDQSAEHGEPTHVFGALLGSGKIATSQYMSHYDANGFTHGNKGNAHQVPDRGLDIQRGHGVQATIGVALVHRGGAQCPESFVCHKRQGLQEEAAGEFLRDLEVGESAADERENIRVLSGIDHEDRKFHKTRNNGCDRSACRAQGRKPEQSVDQKPVSDQIDEDRAKGCDHGYFCTAEIFQRAGIGLRQTDGDQADEDHFHVADTDLKDLCRIGRIALALKEEPDQKR